MPQITRNECLNHRCLFAIDRQARKENMGRVLPDSHPLPGRQYSRAETPDFAHSRLTAVNHVLSWTCTEHGRSTAA